MEEAEEQRQPHPSAPTVSDLAPITLLFSADLERNTLHVLVLTAFLQDEMWVFRVEERDDAAEEVRQGDLTSRV